MYAKFRSNRSTWQFFPLGAAVLYKTLCTQEIINKNLKLEEKKNKPEMDIIRERSMNLDRLTKIYSYLIP